MNDNEDDTLLYAWDDKKNFHSVTGLNSMFPALECSRIKGDQCRCKHNISSAQVLGFSPILDEGKKYVFAAAFLWP